MGEGGNQTIYVIDDDASVRRSLKRLLRSSGYQVEGFASGAEFLERQRAAGAGCVLLDVRMPGISGPELFERMSRGGESLPVIFLTGHGDVPTSVHAMKGGAVDFLLKPVDAESLLRAVEEAIRRHASALARVAEDSSIRTRLARLSPREREVLEHVTRGEPNKNIAAQLGISEKTVKVHRHRVMEKMEAGSLAELVRLADAALSRPADARGSPAGGRAIARRKRLG